MATDAGWFRTERDGDRLVLSAGGRWEIASAASLDAQMRAFAPEAVSGVRIELSALEGLDTAGAWILCRTLKRLRKQGLAAEFTDAREAHAALLARVEASHADSEPGRDRPSALVALLERAGRGAMDALREGAELTSFLGVTVLTGARAVLHPRRLRLTSTVHHLEKVGLDAMPIVGLLAFLIGIVIAYQGADQLSRFGAAIFTVDLLGVSILREMGVLLTAIIIAGRSGAAFTAQIGTMQVNEEVDAMRTIGLDPIEMLVLPRVLALIIALPLLAVYADMMGLAGGALMSFAVLDISFVQFVERLKSSVPLWSYGIGVIKAPVFGFLIGLVGCREGLKVAGSAESVGRQTTTSVAVAIFLVILVDAMFSVFFSYVGI